MTKRTRLIDIVKCCEIRFNRGDVTTWKHGDFVDLNREIDRDTGINISTSTLKRIFGKISVDEDYIPQQATLDALKKYGNYIEPENPLQAIAPAAESVLPNKSFPRFKIVILILVVIAAIAGITTWRLLKPQNISGKISITRIEGDLPATAFFELQIPESDDSLFINFGDKSPLTYVNPGEKNAAHIYYFPGLFIVSIQTRRQAIASTSAYIKSGNWIGLAFHNQQDIPNHFYEFPAVKTGSDSMFQFTTTQLSKMGLDTAGLILTRLCNYMPVAHNSDDFIFETTFKSSLNEKSIYCRGTQFQISGANGMIRFKFVNSGCSLRVLNVVSEQTFKGATDDLSQFVLDLRKWNTVKLINRNKHVSLYVNGKQIFAREYQRPLGDLKGLFLEFEGAGVVKSCDLKSHDGNALYHF